VERTPIRDRRLGATRAHIAETALVLFVSHGYAETTIDQIAAAAHVGRRTIFRHFATKAAILFDRLVVRREILIQLLRQRPTAEPPLVSLHAVMRELCDRGYDRRVLAQIRAVIAAEPRLGGEELWAGVRAFESELVATVARRRGERRPSLESHALTLMAVSWFVTAAHAYVTERSRSLVECFDEAVATCVRASADGFGGSASLDRGRAAARPALRRS
jgi:AcrR family transcriptional regulator